MGKCANDAISQKGKAYATFQPTVFLLLKRKKLTPIKQITSKGNLLIKTVLRIFEASILTSVRTSFIFPQPIT